MSHDVNLPEHDHEVFEPQVSRLLDQWRAPQGTPVEKQRMLAVLNAELDAQERRVFVTRGLSLQWTLLILRAQLRVIHRAIWIGSALILSLGAVVTLFAAPGGLALVQLPFVLIAPVVTGVGAAFLYGEGIDPPLELQQTTPVRPGVVLLARLTLLFGFNLTLALAMSVVLAVLRSEISLVPLIAAWLAPMVFLSALAFVLSVIWFDARLSVGIALAIWMLNTVRHFADVRLLPPIVTDMPDLLSSDVRPLLMISAAAFVIAGLWISEREERHLRS